MASDYSVETINALAGRFTQANVHRPMRVDRYEAGAELTYEVTGVAPARSATVRLTVERFVGGGFAGQVYRVRIDDIDAPDGPVDGLTVGGVYAIKILLPPSKASKVFRDAIYRVGFQSPFSLQVNPSAARAGAIWQKFIRRAAGERFDDERSVVDIYATFVDSTLGSCGEISEWVEGRTWRFEVDGRLFERHKWKVGQSDEGIGSPEYRAKKTFMKRFVELLHELGAPEFARQYEWWTCKSQPNALKRLDTGDDPVTGLTAVDFRAGLALLAFLPMSPGDVPLICKGLARGSLVQFDRGDIEKLRAFVTARPDRFADMAEALDELEAEDGRYRDSQIDVTHNHVRLLYSGRLWGSIFDATVASWRIRNMTDDETTDAFGKCRPSTLAFALLGMISPLGMLAAAAMLITGLFGDGSFWAALGGAIVIGGLVPVLAQLGRKLWGRVDYQKHVHAALTNGDYFRRVLKARNAEMLIRWVRKGRVSDERAMALIDQPLRLIANLPLSILPAFLHRMLTDIAYALDRLGYVFVRPIRLYFRADAREQWLREMIAEGQKRHMLSDDDAERILSRVKEPFIQKYLKSLAVHVCTLPVTQVVSVAVATWFYLANPDMPKDERALAVAGILVLFQVIPLSPGSLVRGFYVLYLVIRERNFKDYNIAVFLGFFKYVGYLAFPIQMAYRYPVLARFMAAHWATGAVHVVPVFGEHGALMEHSVFDLFYNYPLTVRRRLADRAERLAGVVMRSWHAIPIVFGAAILLTILADAWRATQNALPTLGNIWLLTLLVPLAVGVSVTLLAGGANTVRKIKLAILSGLGVGVGYSLGFAALALVRSLGGGADSSEPVWTVLKNAAWAMFIFTLLTTIAGAVTEINLPLPNDQSKSSSQ